MKSKIVGIALSILGIFMISIAGVIQEDNTFESGKKTSDNATMDIVNVINMSSTNRSEKAEVVDLNLSTTKNNVVELSMEQAPQSVYIPPRVEVYEGMTLEELSAKLERSLGGVLSGKGSLIASKCVELGIDPYIVTAIMLHETGCRSNCSNLVKYCNNVGGQKGSPSCGNGSYKAYATLDDGIVSHIQNLYNNYFSKGRTTVETIAPKYAEGSSWPGKINWYVNLIRAS